MAFVSAQWHPSMLVIAEDYMKAGATYGRTEIPLALTPPIITKAHDRTFEAEGPGWAQWKPSYAPYAESHNKGILWQHGELHEGATSEGSLLQVHSGIAWTGAAAPFYWGFHEYGTVKMVARPFLGLDATGEKQVQEVFDRFMESVGAVAAGRNVGVSALTTSKRNWTTQPRDASGRFMPFPK